MTTTIVVDVLGWIGAVLLLFAYTRVSSGRWHGQSRPYQLLNAAGSVLFIINTAYHRAFPPVFLNTIWAAVAIWTLARVSGSPSVRPD